jgi:hypothetical protein
MNVREVAAPRPKAVCPHGNSPLTCRSVISRHKNSPEESTADPSGLLLFKRGAIAQR